VQARIFVRMRSRAAEPIVPAPSNVPVRQLRVGKAPAPLTASTRNGVPSS